METLEAVDSINIDSFDYFQISNVVSIGDDWLAMNSTKGDYNILFINTKSKEHFYVVRRGRGPGEIIQGSSLHKVANDLVYYDLGNYTCIRILVEQTLQNRSIVLDTVAKFKSPSCRPVYLCSAGGGYISGRLDDSDVWYSYYNRKGEILSDVETLKYEELTQEYDSRISVLLSSKYASKPDGTKVCVANVCAPAISFANLSEGQLSEYKRYEAPAHGIHEGRSLSDVIGVFHGIGADENFVYLIYSGHKYVGDVLPVHECRHLIIYDWAGTPVRHFYLDKNISSLSIDGEYIWGGSTHPQSMVYKFRLPDLVSW